RGGSSDVLGPRGRPIPARISGASFFDVLPLSEFGQPWIFRLGGLGLASDDDDRAVRLDLVAGNVDARSACLLGHAGERRSARLACGRRELVRNDEAGRI